MILRRPYAFLIKHFRLINFILAIISGFIAYKTFQIARFFIDYISNGYTGAFYEGYYTNYISLSFYVALILLVFGLISLVVLFIYKKRQNKVYLGALGFYLLSFVLLSLVKGLMISMETTVITAEASRAYRDISLILLIPQFTFIIFFLMYGFGFNFSKFNFQQDLRDLQISEEDSEEVEITIKKDNVKLQRNLRRFSREFIYYIKENRFIFILICVGVAVLLGYVVYKSLPNIIDDTYIQGDMFTYQNVSYRIEDSIITNLDYKGDTLKNGKYYLVIKLYAKNNTTLVQSLNYNNFRLEVDNNYYYPISDKGDNFIDYAKNFFGSDIKGESENTFSLVYELDPKEVRKTYRIKISNGSAFVDKTFKGKYNYVTITPIIVDRIVSEGEYEVGKEIVFNNSNLKDTKFTVTDYQVSNRYTYKYQSCIRSDMCTEYQNMINVGFNTNEKTLLILGYDYQISESIPFYSYSADISSFASSFFKIKYEYNGEEVVENVKDVTPSSDKSKLVLEVPSKVRDTSHFSLVIRIRNKEYLVKFK